MTGLWPEGCGGALRAQIIKKPAHALRHFDRSEAEWRNLTPPWYMKHGDRRSLDSEHHGSASCLSPIAACGSARDDGGSRQRTAVSGHPPANACYPAKGTLKGISIQNTHASMTWFSKSAAGVIVEGAGRKDVSFPIISFEEAYYGELQSL